MPLFATLLVIGVVCVIAAVVGGGLSVKGVEIPVVSSSRRQGLLAAVGVAVILGSFVLRPQATEDSQEVSSTDLSTRPKVSATTDGRSGRTSPPTASVQSANSFKISLGVTVKEGEPQGAGSIFVPGQVQRYEFQAESGQIVYLKALPPSDTDGSLLGWKLIDSSGRQLADPYMKDDIGRQVLQSSGIHTVEVYSYGGSTGRYAFSILAVPS